MCRPTRSAIAAIVAALMLAAVAGADEVEDYLERSGLTALLAVHLEDRLDHASGEEREALVLKLSSLYARLLQDADDPVHRLELNERSRRLLAMAPAGSANDLRYELLHASYRAAEAVAERHRVRDATDEELNEARATFSALIPDLHRLREGLKGQVEHLQRRLSRASGTGAIALNEEADRAQGLLDQTTYHLAWALYYQSWLHDRADNARVAQDLFALLLGFEDEPAVAARVSEDLRSVEAIARSILGMALCRSLTSSAANALEWLDLLEREQTFGPLREQLPAWRLVVLVEHDDFVGARALLDAEEARHADDGTEVPLLWLRLAAVAALERESDSRWARELARDAVAKIARRGALADVFELAQRYGADALGGSGFALWYVRGVLSFYEARNAHGADEPTDDPALTALYARAAEEFEQALAESDADQHEAVRPDCTRSIAWCLYYQGALEAAARRFREAAAQLPRSEAAEALWMAYVSLDRRYQDAPEDALGNELAALADLFLRTYPSSDHAGQLVYRRAVRTEEVSVALVDELLAIPPTSEVHDAARDRAERILYHLFRRADPAARGALGERYLALALALHEASERGLDVSDRQAVDRFVVRARCILEIALSEEMRRVVAARAVLDDLDALVTDGIDLEELAGELSFRRLQVSLIDGAFTDATVVADALHESGEVSVWSRLSSRAIFREADRRWRESKAASRDDREALAAILRYGQRVLDDLAATDEDDLKHPSVLAAHAKVAEAAFLVWQRSGQRDRGAQALRILDRLLEEHPRNARFLRLVALLTERLGPPHRALACWRALVAGSAEGTPPWYEAKLHLLRLLEQADPDRAREILAQHRHLHPDYGPEPWGPRLREIHLRLGLGAPPGGGGADS